MNKFFTIVLICFTLFLQSCSTTRTFWVNSTKSECSAGAGNTQCILISKDESIKNMQWEYFYSNIEGFNFKYGYFQKIKVKVTELNKSEVPADASSLKYSLIKVVEETQDNRIKLNDIWVAKVIYGEKINPNNNLPQLEINVAKMQVIGNDGCNHYSGAINVLTETEISFGNIASTRKMCADMAIPNTYNEALSITSKYSLIGLNLIFFDNEGNQTIELIKVD